MFPFKSTILDFLYPPFCVGCGKDGAWLCEACLHQTPLLAKERTGEEVHIAPYAHPTVRKLITNLKYQSATCLTDAIGALLDRYAKEVGKPDWSGSDTIIASVPASEGRLRERGIDQAAIIADVLRDKWFPNAKRENLLKRTRHTLTNAQLEDEKARQGNVMGAFMCSVKRVACPQRQQAGLRGGRACSVILVDDVYTTGATMNECARVLKEAGVTDVKLFTIAKG